MDTGLTDEDAYSWLLLNSDKMSSTIGVDIDLAAVAGSSNAMLPLPAGPAMLPPSNVPGMCAAAPSAMPAISPGNAGAGVAMGGTGSAPPQAIAMGAELSMLGEDKDQVSLGGQGDEEHGRRSKLRNSSTASDEGGEPTDARTRAEKKRLRLERNRECARECRRRKRDHTSELEARVAELEAENTHLQLQLKAGREGRALEEQKKDGIVGELQMMVEGKKPEGQILAKIKEFGARHADYGTDRRSAVRWHLEQAERLLVPTQVTKMALWTVQQDDAFYEEREADSLSKIIFRELQLTDKQKNMIRSHRERIRELAAELRQLLQSVRSLREQVDAKNASLNDLMDEMQTILTPTQTARFVLWVSKNQACMAMLSKLWDKL